MRNLFIYFVGIVASTAVLAADSNEVVARMGTVELRRSDVQQLAAMQGIDLSRASSQTSLALEQAVRLELIQRHILDEANKSQWGNRPEVMAQIEQARTRVVVASYMNELTRPAANYPGEAELQAAYDANKARFTVPIQYHVAQIYIKVSEGVDSGEREAEDAWRKASLKGANFGELAKSLSAHKQSALQGGDMGWLPEDQLIPELRTVLDTMTVGSISKPVKAQDGWHVLKLIERKEASVLPFSDVKANLVQALRLQRAKEKEREYLNQLAAKNPISVNEIALSHLVSGER